MNIHSIYKRTAKKVRKQITYDFETWWDKYKPLGKPSFEKACSKHLVDCSLWDTDPTICSLYGEQYIWTAVRSFDSDNVTIINGTRFVDREGFIITENKWKANTDIFVEGF